MLCSTDWEAIFFFYLGTYLYHPGLTFTYNVYLKYQGHDRQADLPTGCDLDLSRWSSSLPGFLPDLTPASTEM